MIIEDRSINDLIMKLSVRKNIGLDAAKRNKDALVEYTVTKTSQNLKILDWIVMGTLLISALKTILLFWNFYL